MVYEKMSAKVQGYTRKTARYNLEYYTNRTL